jgi:hypothetical protein
MLRHLQTHIGKNADATFFAATPTVRGRIVQKDLTNGIFVLPTSQEGLYFLNRDNFPTGLMTAEGEVSDYDTRLEIVKIGEYGVLEKPVSGERYATSEYVTTDLAIGDYLIVEVAVGENQGKLKKNVSATQFKYCGTKDDNGHTLAVVEVL